RILLVGEVVGTDRVPVWSVEVDRGGDGGGRRQRHRELGVGVPAVTLNNGDVVDGRTGSHVVVRDDSIPCALDSHRSSRHPGQVDREVFVALLHRVTVDRYVQGLGRLP